MAEDAFAVGVGRLPGDDEAAIRQICHRRPFLVVERRGVDLELGADGVAAGIIALAEDALFVAVLILRIPGHEEAAVRQPRDRWPILVSRREGIDLELGADGIAAGIIALAEDALLIGVGGRPGDDEATIRQGRGRWDRLISNRGGIDLELRAGRRIQILSQDVDRNRGGIAQGAGIGDLEGEAVAAAVAGVGRVGVASVGCNGHRAVRGAGAETVAQDGGLVFRVGRGEGAADRHAILHAGEAVRCRRRVVDGGDGDRRGGRRRVAGAAIVLGGEVEAGDAVEVGARHEVEGQGLGGGGEIGGGGGGGGEAGVGVKGAVGRKRAEGEALDRAVDVAAGQGDGDGGGVLGAAGRGVIGGRGVVGRRARGARGARDGRRSGAVLAVGEGAG